MPIQPTHPLRLKNGRIDFPRWVFSITSVSMTSLLQMPHGVLVLESTVQALLPYRGDLLWPRTKTNRLIVSGGSRGGAIRPCPPPFNLVIEFAPPICTKMNDFKFDFSKIFWGVAHRAPSPDPSPRFFSGFALGSGFALNSQALCAFDSGASRPRFGLRPQLLVGELGLAPPK